MISYTDMSVEELKDLVTFVFEANGKQVSGLQFLDGGGKNVSISRIVINHDAGKISVSILPTDETLEQMMKRTQSIFSPDLPESTHTLKK